jgi:hypothetical protein
MPSTRQPVAAVVAIAAFTTLTTFVSSGCVSSAVARGALIGAASGAVLGVGTGVLISDDKLLGSTPQSHFAIGSAESIGAASLIGTVFGAIVGAMIGHQSEPSVRAPETPEHATARAAAPSAF